MRGRIVAPFLIELAQLDTAATAAGSPGYDALFREPRTTIDAAGQRTKGRKEKLVQCRGQIETGTYELQQMTPGGNAPLSALTIVFHYQDLEDAGLIGPENRPLINVNDRVTQFLNYDDGTVASSFKLVPVYLTEVTPSGFGFGGRVNLVVCRVSDRPQAVRPGGA